MRIDDYDEFEEFEDGDYEKDYDDDDWY